MQADPRSTEAAAILRGLTGIHGGSSVKVLAKKFPRRAPADGGTGYAQEEYSFPVEELPDPAPPVAGDEIVITLQGVLDDQHSTINLLSEVHDLLGKVESSARWDTRTFVGDTAKRPRAFRVTFFTDPFGVVPGA